MRFYLAIFSTISFALTSCKQNTIKDARKIEGTTSLIPIKTKNKESLAQGVDKLPYEVAAFVPQGFSILDTASGDLNLDGSIDLVMVLKKNGEDTLSDVVNNPERRPLILLIRDQNNKLTLARRNDNTVYCIDCGGMMGDPYMGIAINNGFFSIEHYGGSAWRWTRIITYKYAKQDEEWLLHKDGSESFHTAEPHKISSTILSAKDFGKVKFEDFDIYNEL